MKRYSIKKLFLTVFFTFYFLFVTDRSGFAGDIIKGKIVYEANCKICHSSEGHPFLTGVPSFSKGERSDKEKRELIRSIKEGHPPKHGAPPMPSMIFSLSDTEIDDVLTYIEILKK